ncbi:MAG: hypothetical protein E7478_10770 [Ruminococcaceae bacterium]|nr:hypothetical protein [Oscillospiraceae bacterium]
MRSRLYIIEGLPCSGKSTTSAFVADALKKDHDVCCIDEGTGEHPADYEFHSFLSESDILAFSEDEQQKILSVSQKTENGFVVPLSGFNGAAFDKLLKYKLYDFLPWETEYPVMLEKWHSFAETADKDTVYVFNCVLLQNPMCETMMRFGFPISASKEYIEKIAEIIKPFAPVVIYLKTSDIRSSVEKASSERDGWLDAVIDYHINGAYGKSINAQGFDGYISCLSERQRRELEILSQLDVESIVIDDAQADWDKTYRMIKEGIL